jgi:hypothetical protein
LRSFEAEAQKISSSPRLAALCLFTPLFNAREALLEEAAGAGAGFPVSVASLRSTLALAGMTAAGRITHEEIVRLLLDGLPLEFVVGLLDRAEVHDIPVPDREPSQSDSPTAPPGQRFWIAHVVADHAMAPEQFLQLVVARRRVLGISDAEGIPSDAHPGDWICFYVAGKGVVGRARIKALVSAGPGAAGLRDAHRYQQLLEVERLELHLDRPVPPDAETHLRLRAALARQPKPAHALVRISEEGFIGLTAPRLAADAVRPQ